MTKFAFLKVIQEGYPAHWQIKQLKYLCVLQRGFDLPSQNRQEGEFPIYGGGGITGYHSKAMVQPPGVVTGRYGTVGEVYLVNEPFWPLNTSLYGKEFWGNSPEFFDTYFQSFQWKHTRQNLLFLVLIEMMYM